MKQSTRQLSLNFSTIAKGNRSANMLDFLYVLNALHGAKDKAAINRIFHTKLTQIDLSNTAGREERSSLQFIHGTHSSKLRITFVKVQGERQQHILPILHDRNNNTLMVIGPKPLDNDIDLPHITYVSAKNEYGQRNPKALTHIDNFLTSAIRKSPKHASDIIFSLAISIQKMCEESPAASPKHVRESLLDIALNTSLARLYKAVKPIPANILPATYNIPFETVAADVSTFTTQTATTTLLCPEKQR